MSDIASMLTERVTIEQKATVGDTFGGQEISWTELATVFAQITSIPSTAQLRSLADQADAVAGYRVRIRARTDVDASMRLTWKTHMLQIHALHEQDGMLELLTYEEQL